MTRWSKRIAALQPSTRRVTSHVYLCLMCEGDIANGRTDDTSTARLLWWEITPLTYGRARLILTDGLLIEDGY